MKDYMMEIPEEFRKLCREFYQGVSELHPTKAKIIDAAIDVLTIEESAATIKYLDKLIASKLSEDELWRLWEQAGSTVRITDGTPGMSAKFLQLIKDALESRLSRCP
jgi:hypothetical protein